MLLLLCLDMVIQFQIGRILVCQFYGPHCNPTARCTWVAVWLLNLALLAVLTHQITLNMKATP